MQIPSPLALVVGGSWAGHLAGGRLPLSSWPSNPQFMLSTQQRAQVMVSLVRSDLRHSLIKEPQSPDAAIGLSVVEVRSCFGDRAVVSCCTNPSCALRCQLRSPMPNAQMHPQWCKLACSGAALDCLSDLIQHT